MKTLYLDCFSGISGDMFIGALIDAGADPGKLGEELKKLQMDKEYELKWGKVNKNGITSTKFDVLLKDGSAHTHDHQHADAHEHQHNQAHAHDHEHSHSDEHKHVHDQNQSHTHSHEHKHDHMHAHDHERMHSHVHVHDHAHMNEHAHDHTHDNHTHGHVHDHSHSHSHDHGHSHHHHHDHRSYKDIAKLIEHAGFEQPVEELALRIFKKIAEAEGKIHGVPVEDVHFHEVGAVDSIIDIVGAAILLRQLGIESVQSSPVPVGKGKIRIDHGIYPVPAPATLEILRGTPLEQSDIRGELTTPTGAAIVSVLAETYGPIPSIKVNAIGYGAGTKTFAEHPNVLRVIIGE